LRINTAYLLKTLVVPRTATHLQLTPHLYVMPSLRFLILPLLFLASVSFAKDALTVDRVKFSPTKDSWVQMEIQISCDGNPAPDAKNARYLEGVKLKAYLAYSEDGAQGKFSYYMSEVEIVIMEKGDTNNVYFYLPGMIVDRDRLKNDPDYFYVEVSIGDNVLPPQKEAMSSSIKNLQILESMKAKANSEGEANADILMPVYLAPPAYLGRIDRLPLFLRRDPRPQQ